MSKAYQIAEGMAAHLNAYAALEGVESIVDRQLDIATEIKKRVFLMAAKSKGKGAMITIFYSGFQNPDASAAATPNITRTYLVSTYGAPTLKSGHMPADDVLETAALRLHRWEPAEAHGISEIHVLNGVARPDSDYLIYDLEVRVTGRL